MIFNLITKAKDLFYSNKNSGLNATNTQDAIDELNDNLTTIYPFDTIPTSGSVKGVTSGGIYKSIHDVSYINPSYSELAFPKNITFYKIGRLGFCSLQGVYSNDSIAQWSELSLTVPTGYEAIGAPFGGQYGETGGTVQVFINGSKLTLRNTGSAGKISAVRGSICYLLP